VGRARSALVLDGRRHHLARNPKTQDSCWVGTPLSKTNRHSIADWLQQPEELRLELIGGQLVQKARSDFRHAEAQFGLADQLRPEFHRRGGGGHPGRLVDRR
jgi:hypothetical protein